MLEKLKAKADWLFPHTIAERASGGRWKAYDYLKIISKEIAVGIAKGNARILVMMPPRHGKSEFISHWIPFWFFHLYPDRKIILASYSDGIAKQWGSMVREEITDNPLTELQVDEDTSAKSDWKIKGHLGSMTTCGIGGAVTSKGGDLLIVDDITKNWEEASSPTIQERNLNWYKSTFHTRTEPKASIVVLGTPWHPKDLLGYLRQYSTEHWIVLRFPAFAEKTDMLGRPLGAPLCPERYDTEALLAKKAEEGSFFFEALYQTNPSLPEGNLVKREHFRRYRELPDCPKMFMDADLTFKKTDEGSFVVIQVWGILKDDFFLIEQFRGRVGFNDQCKELTRLHNRFPKAQEIFIEDAASAQSVIDTLKHEVRGIKAVHVDTDKVSRFLNIVPSIENGRVHVPEGKMGDEFIEELCLFPNSENNDQVDATSLGIGQMQHKTKITAEILIGSKQSSFFGK